MIRILFVASCFAAGALLLPDGRAFGHGCVYRGPGAIQNIPTSSGAAAGGGGLMPGGGPTTGGPGNPGGGTGAGGPGGGGAGAGGPGGRGPGPGPGGGGGGGGGGGDGDGMARKKNAGVEGAESWSYWWEHNRHRFVNVRAALEANTQSTGETGFLTGQGDKGGATASSRPTSEEVSSRIVPSLKSVLGEDDADIVDSAVLSLGRIVRAESASVCFDDLEAALGSKYNSVQQSTILALGVLGSKDAIPVLVDVLNDTAAGRKALKLNGQIHDVQRAFAALALGYIGSLETIPMLKAAIVENSDTEKSIRAAAIVALGQFEDGKDEIIPFLRALLDDDKMHQDTAAQIPLALARLGGVAAIPELKKLATSRKTEDRVEESCVIALGMLAQPEDKEVVADLMDKIEDGSNDQARHFAIMALSQIAERAFRADESETDKELITGITNYLLKEMADAKKKAHEPWAGLAVAIVGAKHAPGGRERNEIALELLEKFENESNPSYKPAYALGLGIVDATIASDAILETLTKSTDPALQGYCAIALGMMRHLPAKEVLRRLLLDDRASKLRFQVATGLGLMGDTGATQLLLNEFAGAKTLLDLASLSCAIGLIGDRRAIRPLERLVADARAAGLARAFGCVALGLLAEKSSLTWNSTLAINSNYRAEFTFLTELLDIL